MKVAILGGGPAGLYCAYLLKRKRPDTDVRVYEQNPADATFGFGVVFSEQALSFLREDDPDTYDLITPAMETWRDITIDLRGERVTIDGVGFSAIGRLELLKLLQARAREADAELRFETVVRSLDELDDADLIVGSDGLNSLVRRTHEGDFLTSLSYFDNKFVWFGTTKEFDTLTQTFVATESGAMNAHHYRYAPGMSTFIVECDRATWLGEGFAEMGEDETKARCEAMFADTLDGHPLVSNKSIWRNFPRLWNDRWSHLNRVLVGDALHTAHFSIGSGTRLALEDVIALVAALEAADWEIGDGLTGYEAARKPIAFKIVSGANNSASWYDKFAERMTMAPLDFAYDYITRSGRIDRGRLRQLSPGFMGRYDEARGAAS